MQGLDVIKAGVESSQQVTTIAIAPTGQILSRSKMAEVRMLLSIPVQCAHFSDVNLSYICILTIVRVADDA